MIVFKYGALKPKVINGTFSDLLAYQRESNRFYNSLVEIERWRIVARHIVETLTGAALTDEQKNEERLAYNQACRSAGKLTPIGWGQKQAVTEMVAAAMKTRRADELKAHAHATRKGWPWLKRIKSCARPRYRRFDGEGLIAATLQGQSGVTAEDVLAGCSHFSISGSGRKRIARLRLRDNLVVEIPIVYHRELPVESAVLFARLAIERVGDRWVYSIHITLKAKPKQWVGLPGAAGKCAINFGWRRVDGGVRVAYAVDESGNESSLVFPQRLIDRQLHAESLRSLADSVATEYLGDARGRTRARREALADPSASNRAVGKLKFSSAQARAQDPADREQWARRDRHLYQWERDEYTATLRARRELYRLWARELARKYASVVVEDFDLRRVIERGPNEQEIPSARHYRFLVGPHYLRLEIKSVFGDACAVLKPAKRSLTCNACGNLCKWDKARALRHACEKCGAEWDQDANNSTNQLADAAQ